MRLTRILPLLLVIGLVGVAAGCGGDDDDEEAAAPEMEAPEMEEEPAGGLTVEMKEFEFIPNDVTIEEGETITADNTGDIVHNFTIEEGTDASEPSKELAASPDVDAGDSAEFTPDLKPGEYALVCTIPGHRESGMIGTFTVE